MIVSSTRSPVGSVGTGMGDGLRMDIPPRHVASHIGQLSLLLLAGQEMSTRQWAVKLCE